MKAEAGLLVVTIKTAVSIPGLALILSSSSHLVFSLVSAHLVARQVLLHL